MVLGGEAGHLPEHQASRHRPVHPEDVRANAVHRGEEPRLLAGRPDRAEPGATSRPSRATRRRTSSTSRAASSTGPTTTCRTSSRPMSPRIADRTYWFPPGGTIGIFLNLTKAPYNDVNFRKGVSLSLNRHDDRAEGGQRVHGCGQPVRADPAERAEVARPEPAQQGRWSPRTRRAATAAFAAGRLHAPGREAGEGRQAGHR